MKTYLKVLYILSWIPVAVIKLILVILGLITVPLAIQFSGGKHEDWPDIFWIWGNEKGVPEWWLMLSQSENIVARTFPNWWWYAIRNPVNNARFIFKDRPPNISGNWVPISMEVRDMLTTGRGMAYRWSYNGPFAGFRRVWINSSDKYSEVWFGWKLGSTVPGLGFTMQVRLRRKIGT